MVSESKDSVTDLILFAGQSNMAGRGNTGEAVSCEAYMGREFRAVSDPERLYPIREPFGVRENNSRGMDDGRKKTGSMVSAFVRKYYELTGHTVIAVSASKGGSSSAEWVRSYAADAAGRLRRARAYLDSAGIAAAHTYVLWSQGETDGDKGLDAGQYSGNFRIIWETLREAGAEKCFLIQTGHYNYAAYPRGTGRITGVRLDGQYEVIRQTQRSLCANGREPGARQGGENFSAGVTCLPDVYMAASFEPYLALMKDKFHYRQQAYNEVGETAAENMARILGQPY